MAEQYLILRPGAIGDTLLTLPVLDALRAAHAGARLVLVGNRRVLPLALALGVVDEVHDYEDLAWSELFSEDGVRRLATLELLRQTRRAICWLRDPTGWVERNLRAAGVAEVTIAPGRPPASRLIHESVYLAETLGLPFDPAAVARRPYRLAGETPSLPFATAPLAIHPGSSTPEKCWPPAHFAAVIRHVWRRGWPVLLLAGPAERDRLGAVMQHLPSQPVDRIKVLFDAPLLELALHLQQARAYLGNDSGITHLAALLGLPTLALFGPSEPAVWQPLGPSVRVLRALPLQRLPVAQVLAAGGYL
jgi:heptosyltransferase-3